MSSQTLTTLRLKKNEERRLRAGHDWIYSNEIDVAATPIKTLEPGQPVRLEDARGKPLGMGYANPKSLICARLMSRDPDAELGKSLLVHRLNVALSLRERLYEQPFYRLVYGEADGLPGLVVDRYGDILVAQLNTAGMERMREGLVEALCQVLNPAAILLRNDSPARELEGLEREVVSAYGEVPEQALITEHGVEFAVPLLAGQKTGWFFDQAANRGLMGPYVRGRRVLDVFSYIGAWGVQAAAHGATQVSCLDSSAKAVEAIAANAARNQLGDTVEALQGDAFDTLRDMRAENRRFDVLMVDPPAFMKRKKDVKAGLQAYRRINQAAMQLLDKDGILMTSSCSHHLHEDAYIGLLQQAAVHLDRKLQILVQGQQGPDHPVHPAIPETRYLKHYVLRVLPR